MQFPEEPCFFMGHLAFRWAPREVADHKGPTNLAESWTRSERMAWWDWLKANKQHWRTVEETLEVPDLDKLLEAQPLCVLKEHGDGRVSIRTADQGAFCQFKDRDFAQAVWSFADRSAPLARWTALATFSVGVVLGGVMLVDGVIAMALHLFGLA